MSAYPPTRKIRPPFLMPALVNAPRKIEGAVCFCQ